MGESVTLELPNELAQRARAIAEQTHRRIEDVLLDWLGRAAMETPLDQLPDDQILALSAMRLSDDQQHELDDLLARQREEALNAASHARLDELMGIYRRGMVRKAQALKVAVERGLLPPLG